MSYFFHTTSPVKKQSFILDIGSGTGHHVHSLHDKGFKTIGLDVSPSMIKKAKNIYPKSTFVLGDALKTIYFQPSTFTHITCLYFTIYFTPIKNKYLLFNNCLTWLKPGGYLVLHLVDRYKFNPIMPAGDPFIMVSPQNYAKKRITTTKVKFNGFEYSADFKLKDDIGVFEFSLKKDGSVRRQEQTL